PGSCAGSRRAGCGGRRYRPGRSGRGCRRCRQAGPAQALGGGQLASPWTIANASVYGPLYSFAALAFAPAVRMANQWLAGEILSVFTFCEPGRPRPSSPGPDDRRMRLSTIKLSGFKSFVDPTTLHLPTNMTGVVGPNGCGKS